MNKMREIVDMVIKEYGEFYPKPGDCTGCDTPYSLCHQECLSCLLNNDEHYFHNDSDNDNDECYWDDDDDDEELNWNE